MIPQGVATLITWNVKMEKKQHHRSKYSPELAEAICAHIVDGGTFAEIESVGVLVDDKKIKISKDTITIWKKSNPEFRRLLSQARDASDLGLFDKIQELCSTDLAEIASEIDTLTLALPLRVQLFTQRCNQIKEHISNIKWRLKILNPEKYGDRILQDVNFKDRINQLSNADLPKEILKVAKISYSDIQSILSNTTGANTKQ